ncbi:MAG: hypothetical protein KC503_03945 [Myxococcales bacterium]|nr:hypothetical protein [Myxococcales bacterium]
MTTFVACVVACVACRDRSGRAPAAAVGSVGSIAARRARRLALQVDGVEALHHLQLTSDGDVLLLEAPRAQPSAIHVRRAVRCRRAGAHQVLHTLRDRHDYRFPASRGGLALDAAGDTLLVWYGQRVALLDARSGVPSQQVSIAGLAGLEPAEAIINARLVGARAKRRLLVQTQRWRLVDRSLGAGDGAWRTLEPPSTKWSGGAALLLDVRQARALTIADARLLRLYDLTRGQRTAAATFAHPGPISAALDGAGERVFVSASYSPPHTGIVYHRAHVYPLAALATGSALRFASLPGGDQYGAEVLAIANGQLIVRPVKASHLYARPLAGGRWCRTLIPAEHLDEVATSPRGDALAVLRTRFVVQQDGTSRLIEASVDIYNTRVPICQR